MSPLPPTGAVYPVAERGQLPVWRPDGAAILYRDGRRFFEVSVELGADVRPGLPRMVAEGPFLRTFAWNHTLSPDGRLAALVSLPGDDTRELGVITGFDRTLLRQAPPRGER